MSKTKEPSPRLPSNSRPRLAKEGKCLMHFFELFNWCELAITSDSSRFSEIVRSLKEANIPHKTKMQDIGNGNRLNGQIGRLGENQQYSFLYQIYVKKESLEKTKHLLGFR